MGALGLGSLPMAYRATRGILVQGAGLIGAVLAGCGGKTDAGALFAGDSGVSAEAGGQGGSAGAGRAGSGGGFQESGGAPAGGGGAAGDISGGGAAGTDPGFGGAEAGM